MGFNLPVSLAQRRQVLCPLRSIGFELFDELDIDEIPALQGRGDFKRRLGNLGKQSLAIGLSNDEPSQLVRREGLHKKSNRSSTSMCRASLPVDGECNRRICLHMCFQIHAVFAASRR